MKKRTILFVCTGNIFRSMSAEYCMKQYLKKNHINTIHVESAGTEAHLEPMNPTVRETLHSLNINPDNHIQRKINNKILKNADLVIAMAEDHKKILKQYRSKNSVLYNELAVNTPTSVQDIDQAIPDFHTNKKAMEAYIKKVIHYIHKTTPQVYKSLSRYFLFSDFASGRKTHANGFPFTPLYKTNNTLAFMSIHIPKNQNAHILVIPKKPYMNFEDIPQNIKTEMMQVVTKIGSVLKQEHGGYNILLNNGRDAGQYIFHAHIHIIPRDNKDNIKIEYWKNKKLTKNQFLSLNKRFKKQLNKKR